jgi:prenyltransferase beta subunit
MRPAGALGAAPNATDQARLDSTVRYLQDVQNVDGGFGGEPGAESDPDFSAWVALALTAAGINPQDQAQVGGVDAYTYLTEHANELTLTTDFERVLLVVDASGTSPHDFAGVDLVDQILGRQLTETSEEGGFVHKAEEHTAGINDTIFAILALSPIQEPAVREAVGRAASWLEDEQNPGGSWPAYCPKTAVTTCAKSGPERGEVDMTGAAIEALNAAGRHDTPVQREAFEYLHEAQDPDGGFPEYPGESEPNVASTAWAAQAIWSAGQSPEAWVGTAGGEPLSYMASMQQPDGHIRFKEKEESLGVWMTAYVAPAFAGQALPITAVPRALPTTTTSTNPDSMTPAAQGTAEPGQGGESSQLGSGVIAGGGGYGAVLFSRPQPQSRGDTPGGVRRLENTHEQASTKKSSTRHHGEQQAGGRVEGRGLKGVRAERREVKGVLAGGRELKSVQAGGRELKGVQAGGREVKGVLIDAQDRDALDPGAPGLHSAGAGGNLTPWPAIAIGGAIVLLVLVGSQLERRRPQAIL